MPSQVIQIPFTGGPLQKLAEQYINPATNLVNVTNGVYTFDGVIQKRLGISALPQTQLSGDPTMGAPVKLLSRGPEVLATDGDSVFSYAPDGTPIWSQRGLVPPCLGTRTETFTLPLGCTCVAFAEGAGRRFVVYRDGTNSNTSGNIWMSLFSLATGAAIIANVQIASGHCVAPNVIWAGAQFNVFYAVVNTQHIVGQTYSANGTFLATTVIATDLGCSLATPCTYFDVTPEVGGSGIVLFYGQVDADTTTSSPRYLRLEALPALTITASVVLVNYSGTGATTTLVSCRCDSTVAWFYWEYYYNESGGQPGPGPPPSGSSQYVLCAQAFAVPAWTSIHAIIVITTMPQYGGQGITGGAGGGGNVPPFSANLLTVEPLTVAGTAANTTALFTISDQICLTGGIFIGGVEQVVCSADGTTVTTAAAGVFPYCAIIGRPFVVTEGINTRCYMMLIYQQVSVFASPNPSCSTYLLDTGAIGAVQGGSVRGRVAAVLAPRQSALELAFLALLTDRVTPLCSSPGVRNAGAYRFPVATSNSEEFGPINNAAITSTSINVGQFDFTGALSYSYAEGNGSSFVSGGVPSYYDGLSFPELSFFSWPVAPVIAITTGTAIGIGTYGYALCWAQLDDQGLIHRSAFWEYNVTTTMGNQAVNLSVLDLPFSGRYRSNGQPFLEIYRTAVNGTIFYFVTALQSSASATYFTVPPTYLSYLDVATDATIETNTLQYTTGGVLDSVCPPSARHMIRHVDRLWLIDDIGQNIWYTTNFNEGDAPYFNETLTLSFTKETLTALASMDDKLVAFSATSIWYVEGYGPANTGLGSDLTTAVQVPTMTGTPDWRSVVSTPDGVYFQSGYDGLIYLLDRGLNVTCVGKVIQDWMGAVADDYPAQVTALSAQMVPLTNQIRWIIGNPYPSEPPVYVVAYDLVQKRWLRSTYTANPGPMHAIQPVGSAWTVCGSDGYVYQELSPFAADPYYDILGGSGATWITMSIQTAEIHLGDGLQASQLFEFVQGMAQILSPASLTMELQYDHDTTNESRFFAYPDLSTGTQAGPNLALWRMSPTAVHLQPMNVSVVLTDSGGYGGSGRGLSFVGLAFVVSPTGQLYDKLGVNVKQ
jgi:hypothetical protein